MLFYVYTVIWLLAYLLDLSDVEGKKYMAGGFQLLEEAEKLKKSANILFQK